MMMPVLEAEESTTAEIFKIPPSEEDHDQCTPAIPKLEIQQERVATNIFKSAPKTFAPSPSSSSRRKYQLFNSDSDLEDEDLQFRGYCYTTIGNDGAKSVNDTYACHYCPAIFDSRVGLTNHAKLHGAEKNMKCEFCDFACTNKKTMRIHRKIHGIIPKRGRQPGTWVQKAMGKSMRKKVKKEEGDEEFAAKIEFNNEVEPVENMQKESDVQRRSTRRRITKSGNLCPAAGAVQVEDDRVQERQEETNERIVIVSKSRGLEEEEPDSEEDTPKKKKRGGRKKQEQVEGNQAGIGAAGTSSSAADKYNLACAICPYRTTQLNYLDQHMLGHSRQSGYVCSVCGFKHEHKRWLNSHCVLHQQKEGLDFQWPPLYVYGEESATAMDGQGGGGQQEQKSPPISRR